jgi:hypothetical protein
VGRFLHHFAGRIDKEHAPRFHARIAIELREHRQIFGAAHLAADEFRRAGLGQVARDRQPQQRGAGALKVIAVDALRERFCLRGSLLAPG